MVLIKLLSSFNYSMLSAVTQISLVFVIVRILIFFRQVWHFIIFSKEWFNRNRLRGFLLVYAHAHSIVNCLSIHPLPDSHGLFQSLIWQLILLFLVLIYLWWFWSVSCRISNIMFALFLTYILFWHYVYWRYIFFLWPWWSFILYHLANKSHAIVFNQFLSLLALPLIWLHWWTTILC